MASLVLIRNYSVSRPCIFSRARSLRFSALCNRSTIAAVASSPIHRVRQWPRPVLLSPPISPSISKHLRRTTTPSVAPTRTIVIRGLDDATEMLLAMGPSTMCQYSSVPKATSFYVDIFLNKKATMYICYTIHDSPLAFKIDRIFVFNKSNFKKFFWITTFFK